MKKLIFTFFFLCSVSLIIAQKTPSNYVCYKAAANIIIDGNISQNEWSKAKWSEPFVDIEGAEKPLPDYNTRIKMLWDEKYFYVAAELEEPHIWANLTKRDAIIFQDNDFEVFIDPDGDNHLYYELEINAFNTVWDLLLVKPYRDGAPATNAWDIKGLKSAVKIFGTINDPSDTDQKWTIEIAFPWNVLKECSATRKKPVGGEQWRINFSRVNWEVEIKNGEYIKSVDPSTGKTKAEDNWVWSPQGAISMHKPERWGYVQFSDIIVGTGKEPFIMDPDYELKMSMMTLYQMEKKYFKNHAKYFNGTYSGGHDSSSIIEIETTSKQFIISSKSKSGNHWHVDHTGRIWSTKQIYKK